MFRKLRFVVLLSIFSLLIVSSTSISLSNGQGDEFPIGLYMAYDIWVDNMTPPGLAYGYNITYNFTSWVIQQNLSIQYERDNDGFEETLIDPLNDILFDVPGNPPI